MKEITLRSGNKFYFHAEDEFFLSFGFVISPKNEFVGGYLCNEAERKKKVFSQLDNITISEIETEKGIGILKSCDIIKFGEKLGTAKNLFINNFMLLVSDYNDASKSQACNSRQYYFRAMNMEEAFQNHRRFYLGLMIANHLSVMSNEKFSETFFHGAEEENKFEHDFVIEVSDINFSKKINVTAFKAPAAYVRNLCKQQ